MYALRIEDLAGGDSSDLPSNGWAELGRELTIGRGADNALVLQDQTGCISKRHCTITNVDGGYVLTDHSRNGTFLNGGARPVTRDVQIALKSGDLIQIGSYGLTVVGMSEQEGIDPASELEELPLSEQSFLGRVVRPGGESELDATFSRHAADDLDNFAGGGLTADDSLLLPARDRQTFGSPAAHSNHVSVTSMIYVQPRLSSEAIPDDWDLLSDLNGRLSQVDGGPGLSMDQEVAEAEENTRDGTATRPQSSILAGQDTVKAIIAFLEGCGLEPAEVEGKDLASIMLLAGRALTATISNIQDDLADMGQLGLSSAENQLDIDPLAFPMKPGGVLLALASPSAPRRMAADEAIDRAFRELRQKSAASEAEVQLILREVSQTLSPEAIERESGTDSPAYRYVPLLRGAKCWRTYQHSHADLVERLEERGSGLRSAARDRQHESGPSGTETSHAVRSAEEKEDGAGVSLDHLTAQGMDSDVR